MTSRWVRVHDGFYQEMWELRGRGGRLLLAIMRRGEWSRAWEASAAVDLPHHYYTASSAEPLKRAMVRRLKKAVAELGDEVQGL